MPIYEYNCTNCKNIVSILFLSISEANSEESVCPECGSKKIERVLSGVSVIKGASKPEKGKPTKSSNNDSKSLAETMKRESSNSKQDYGDDFKEVAYRLEKGENANSIEKKLRKRVGEEMETH